MMKIDMGTIYVLSLAVCFVFQEICTSVNTVYDASYYVDGELKQASFTSVGASANPIDLRNFISKDEGAEDVVVVTFAKRESIRVFDPVWK